MTANGVPSPAEITQTIYDCVTRVKLDLDPSRLSPEIGFRELGLSSIEAITVIFEIEETFDIILVDAGLDDFKNIAHGTQIICSLLARREAAAG